MINHLQKVLDEYPSHSHQIKRVFNAVHTTMPEYSVEKLIPVCVEIAVMTDAYVLELLNDATLMLMVLAMSRTQMGEHADVYAHIIRKGVQALLDEIISGSDVECVNH